jgi:type IV pilus assembly protein PilY1
MNKLIDNNSHRFSVLSRACVTASFSVLSAFVHAAPGVLSDQPLSLVTSTKPNILLLLDDSGSMDYQAVVTNEAQNAYGVDVDNDLAPITRISAENDQERRALCVGYNALAYDPTVKYEKWVDYIGNIFPDNQSIDMTSVVDNPFSGLGSIRTSDLTDHIYMRWDDFDGDGLYDAGIDAVDFVPSSGVSLLRGSECGPSISQYDSAAAESIAMETGTGISTSEETEGTFTDSNAGYGGKYRADDSGTFVVDVPTGGDASSTDTLTFTVIEFNVDSSNDSDSLTVYGGSDVSAPIVDSITVVSQFNDNNGGLIPVSGSTYQIPTPNNTPTIFKPTISSTLVLNDDFDGDRRYEVHQFTVNGSTATFVFNGGSNFYIRSGFIISWVHSDSIAGPPGDGLLTKADCNESDSDLHCVVVANLPLTAADVPSTSLLPYNTQENYATWYTYYRNRLSVAKKALSDVVHENEYRLGFATLNDNGNGGALVKDMENDAGDGISADKSNLLEKIYATRTVIKPDSAVGTPLIKGLSNAGRYFKEGVDPDSDFFGSTGASPHTPIALTHQEDDDNNSSNDRTIDKSPIFTNAYGGECQQNFTLVFTDGAWGDDVSDYLDTDHDVSASAAYFMGDQDSLGTYAGGAYADRQIGGTGVADTLADVAMYYFAEDLAPSVRNSLSVELHDDTITQQHMVTFAVGFGVNGNVTDAEEPTDYNAIHNLWPNPVSTSPDRIDDLRHAAFNGRGEYVSATNSKKLKTALDRIISEIDVRLSNTATGASFSAFQLTDGEFRFSSSYETANWSGDLNGFAYDSNTNSFSETPWSADAKMSDRGDRHLSRNIITSNGTKGIPFKFSFTNDYRDAGEDNALSQTQVADLLKLAPHTANTDIPNTADVDEIARNQIYGEVLVSYLRGNGSYDGVSLDNTSVSNSESGNSASFASAIDDSTLYSFRNREGHYLGSMIHSQPEFVGAPNNTYPDDIESEANLYSTFVDNVIHKDRRKMIYIGANDGMLHGFYATDIDAGDEVFSYVPSMLSDASWGGKGLRGLSLEEYDGQTYVDGSPNVSDVFVNREYEGDTSFSEAQWRSYLVGGLRSGGRGIYVLDVTNPDTTTGIPHPRLSNAEAEADRIVVNEFVHEKLGYVYSRPLIGKMNNGRWAAIIGNGYNSSESGSSPASLFIIYLDAPTEKFTDPNTNVVTYQTTDSDGDGILNNGYGDYSIITATEATWLPCADDGAVCTLSENAQVRYGSGVNYTSPIAMPAGDFTCNTATLGNPGAAAPKCEYSDNNGLSQPEMTDLDGNGTMDRVYAGDLHGNMWVFNISDPSANNWDLHVPDKPFFTACSVDLLISGVCPYISRQPITAKPVIRNNPIQSESGTTPNKLVFFGTGQYLTLEDRSSINAQSFYAVWDAGTASYSLDKNNLEEQVIDNSGDKETRTITSKTVNYSDSSGDYGWYYRSLPGSGELSAERVVIDPLVFSNILVFSTLIPSEGLCNASAGVSYLMAVDALTGGNPPVDVFGIADNPHVAGIRIDGVITGLSVTKSAEGDPSVNTRTADDNDNVPGEGADLNGRSGGIGGLDNDEPGAQLPNPGRKTWSITQ